MTKKRANITPADIDTYYSDGQKVYQLISCESEPHALMRAIAEGTDIKRAISGFANFVRLRPERPIVKPPAPRKTRSDKGTKRPQKQPEQIPASPAMTTPEPVVKKKKKKVKGSLDISTFSLSTEQKGTYQMSMGGIAVSCETLREGITELFGIWGINEKFVEDAPDSEGKRNLLGILQEEGGK